MSGGPRPWRVHTLTADTVPPLTGDTAAVFVSAFGRADHALATAAQIAGWGDLGGWPALITHADINAALVVCTDGARTHDEWSPTTVTFRPFGPGWRQLLQTVAAAIEVPA